MQLSTHFWLKEFVKSATAIRNNIDNTPTSDIICNGIQLCKHILEPTRQHFKNRRVTISSGYRCLELNRLLHSKDTSQHILFEAADFGIDGYTDYEVAKWIANSNLLFDQVIYEFGEWVHVSYSTIHKPRKEALTIYRKKGEVVTERGILPI